MSCCGWCCTDERSSLGLFLAVDATWMWIQGFRAFFGCIWDGGWWNAFVAVVIIGGCLPTFVLCLRAHNRDQPGPDKHFLIYAFKNFLLSVFAVMWTMVAFGWKWPAAGLTWLFTVPLYAFGAITAYRCSGAAFNLKARALSKASGGNNNKQNGSQSQSSSGTALDNTHATPIAIVSAQPSVLQMHHRQPNVNVTQQQQYGGGGGGQQTLDAARHSSQSLFKYFSPSVMGSAQSTPSSTMPHALDPVTAMNSYLNMSQHSLVHVDSNPKLKHLQADRPRPARRHSRNGSAHSSALNLSQPVADEPNTTRSGKLSKSKSRSACTLASGSGSSKSSKHSSTQSSNSSSNRRKTLHSHVAYELSLDNGHTNQQTTGLIPERSAAVTSAMAIYGVECETERESTQATVHLKHAAKKEPMAAKTPPPPPPNKPKIKHLKAKAIRLEDDTLDARMFTPTQDHKELMKANPKKTIGRRQLAAKVSFSSRENSPSPSFDMSTHM